MILKKGFKPRRMIDTEPCMAKDKEGKWREIPYSSSYYSYIPVLPSDCDRFITYFKNLKNFFTDEEIIKLNLELKKEWMNDWGEEWEIQRNKNKYENRISSDGEDND